MLELPCYIIYETDGEYHLFYVTVSEIHYKSFSEKMLTSFGKRITTDKDATSEAKTIIGMSDADIQKIIQTTVQMTLQQQVPVQVEKSNNETNIKQLVQSTVQSVVKDSLQNLLKQTLSEELQKILTTGNVNKETINTENSTEETVLNG